MVSQAGAHTLATRINAVLGSLVAAAKSDPSLQAYGAIVIDEAHQHTVDTDILLGLLKTLLAERPDDLRIIIMSATIDADTFSKFYPGSAVETVGGRQYPVDISYLASPPLSDGVDTIVQAIIHVHLFGRRGNILVFMSGVPEMRKIIRKVDERLVGSRSPYGKGEIGPLSIYPLSAQQSSDENDKAVESVARTPEDGTVGRKLIVATNIAETSVTLEIVHVIDSCKVKNKIWNPQDESWCLREQLVSKATAGQRAGRAGRTRPGTAVRMCTEDVYQEQMPEHSVPAIMMGDMLTGCLNILKLNRSPLNFPYIAAPATETVQKALSILSQFGAIDKDGNLADRGHKIARLPVDVYSAVTLLESQRFECSDEIISLISMVEASEGSSLFKQPQEPKEKAELAKTQRYFSHDCGDHIMLFNVYMAWRQVRNTSTEAEFLAKYKLQVSVLRSADETRLQLLSILRGVWANRVTYLDPDTPAYYTTILRALAAGNYLRVAKRVPGGSGKEYQTVRHGAPATLQPSTKLGAPSRDNEWVIYNEYHNDGARKPTLRLVSPIQPEILIQAQPKYWCDVEFFPKGHIQDDLAKVIAGMTGQSEDYVRGGIPPKPAAATTSR